MISQPKTALLHTVIGPCAGFPYLISVHPFRVIENSLMAKTTFILFDAVYLLSSTLCMQLALNKYLVNKWMDFRILLKYLIYDFFKDSLKTSYVYEYIYINICICAHIWRIRGYGYIHTPLHTHTPTHTPKALYHEALETLKYPVFSKSCWPAYLSLVHDI